MKGRSHPRRVQLDVLDSFVRRVRAHESLVGVVGLGYVGLPLAVLFASRGFRILGFDVDAAKVSLLLAGRSYILSVPSARLRALRRDASFDATSDFRRLSEPDVLILCVPTPLKENQIPDLSFVRETARQVGRRLRHGQLVSLESTTYPGTTREIVLPALARGSRKPGRDFFLSYSPERVDPGNDRFPPEKIPKVIGALDAASLRAASSFYREAFEEIVPVSSLEAAEATKLLENIYRSVNIALVNELKMLYDRMGIDVWEVIRAASTKPFGFQTFWPGPGWGGHCIPLDPFYLSWKARSVGFPTRFIELAGEINRMMPHYVLQKLQAGLRERGKELSGARVLILGLAYKKDIDDPRESPAFPLIELLREHGANPTYHDPYIRRPPRMRHFPGLRVRYVPLTPAVLRSQDAVIIVTDHSKVDYGLVVRHAPLVVDTRNATRETRAGRSNVVLA